MLLAPLPLAIYQCFQAPVYLLFIALWTRIENLASGFIALLSYSLEISLPFQFFKPERQETS